MERLTQTPQRESVGAWRGLAWAGGALATAGAAAVGVVLAVVFAASLVVIGLMGLALIVFAGLAARARRRARAGDASLIEARHVGGHSWIAYGWDGPAR